MKDTTEVPCTCGVGTMFWRHLHEDGCPYAKDGDEAPLSPDEKRIAELEAELSSLQQEIERLNKRLDEWQEAEASVCPEDWGFVEYIKHLASSLKDSQLTDAELHFLYGLPLHPGDCCVTELCRKCGAATGRHGWIDTLEGGNDGAQLVCPGDWIITGIKGEKYPCKPDVFAQTYEFAEAPDV